MPAQPAATDFRCCAEAWKIALKTELAVDLLNELLTCDFGTGRLTFKSTGRPALNSIGARGYRIGRVAGKTLRAHRVIWAMAHGFWPGEIDHINGDPLDNRLVNLRPVSHVENLKNQRLPKNNKSGAAGVNWVEKKKKWQAQIQVNRKIIYLGAFEIKDVAIAARKTAEVMYGFHKNHGSIA